MAIIGFEELFRQEQLIVAENYRPFELYAAVALIYLALTLVSSRASSYLEYRLNPAKHKPSAKQAQRDEAYVNAASKSHP